MEYRVSHFPMLSRFFLTANEKDFSLSLEMTMRGLVSLGVLAFQSPDTSHLSPLPNLALPAFPLVKYK